MDVAGKIVVVTGGGGGIGAGIADAFAERGARVVITDINAAYVEAEAQRMGGSTIGLVHDVADEASWASVKASVEAALGPVDILCNNAGIALPFKPMEDVTTAEFDRVLGVNVRGVFLGCKTFMPEMKARGSGHIVNTSSVNGQLPFQSFAVYSASKFAVTALSEAIRDELEPFGVGVSILYPGLTRSRMSEGQIPDLSETARQAMSAMMMEPIWLGRAVVRAVEDNRLHIITHPSHLPALEARHASITSAFGAPAQPDYTAGKLSIP